MYRGPAMARGQIEPVYEGRAVSEGPVGNLTEIVPYMIRSMFENFPGNSGQTHSVALMRRAS
jgi:hypothetical protein